jgi:alpha-L-fucosidase
VESWALCPEDWVTRPVDDYFTYVRDYRATKAAFNPVNLDAAAWAQAFRGAGARYVIFTTKHHDGFCLWDTAQTDFKVTDAGCPFSRDPRADVFRTVADACRAAGLRMGAYFSKPDWASAGFWWPYYPPKDRNPNYDITKHPERWQSFVRFTHAQLDEITTQYGPLDMLWLDGCWLRPLSTIDARVEEFCKYPHDLDIGMDAVAARVRARQPGILVVDRWVPGPNEDYETPEQRIPAEPPPGPWESCITIGRDWGWTPNDPPKPARELIQLLVRVVAKGGNLLLGVGPRGDGSIEPEVLARLAELGAWLEANGAAIYGSEPIAPYEVPLPDGAGSVAYTRGADGTRYAIVLPSPGKPLPAGLTLAGGAGEAAQVLDLTPAQRATMGAAPATVLRLGPAGWTT